MPSPRGSALRRSLCALVAAAALALLTGCATSQRGTGASAPADRNSGAVAVFPNAAASTPATMPRPVAANYCAGNTRDQFVKVSLRAQHMWLCHGAKTVLATAITSGASALPNDSTPTGTFQIQGRNTNTVLTLNTGRQYDVRYWIPFNAPLYGFHDSSWQRFPYGSPQYRTDGSHGCVHMPLAAITFFYHWVHVGTAVRIQA